MTESRDPLSRPQEPQAPRLPAEEVVTGERLQALADITVTSDLLLEPIRPGPDVPVVVFDRSFSPTEAALERLNRSRIVFVYGDLVDPFMARVLPELTQPFVLVTHNTDSTIGPAQVRALDSPLILHWFGPNAVVRHPKLTPLPIGLANARWPHGDPDALATAAATAGPRKVGVYANFAIATNPVYREPVYAALRRKPFVHWPRRRLPLRMRWQQLRSRILGRPFDPTGIALPYPAYLAELASWRYCVSPRGNGIDCHRTWEALYLGTVPVVSEVPVGLLDGLPHIRVADLRDITLDDLESAYSRLDWSIDWARLRLSHWRRQILAKAGRGPDGRSP